MTKKLFYAAMLVLCLVLAVSCTMIVREVTVRERESSAFESLSQAVYGPLPAATAAPVTERPAEEEEPEPAEEPAIVYVSKRNLAPLAEANSEFLAWICIPGTNVDYPVMYTPAEPQKYLHADFEGNYSLSGVPFLQENGSLESQNLVVYGHNMKNGTMFADVTNYVSEDFAREHGTIEFETVEGVRYFAVYAAVRVKNTDEWYAFESAAEPAVYEEQLALVTGRALYTIGEAPAYGRPLLTLSTCYGSERDDRLIVIAAEDYSAYLPEAEPND